MKPSVIGKRLYKEITKLDKIAILTVWIIGILAHLRIFMQDIPNHDGLDSINFDQNMITSGRWFLSSIAGISSDYTLPWLIGALSLLYLSITALFLCRFLNIKNGFHVVIISGLLVSYPTITSNFAYIFTADAYFFALLLSVLAVCVVEYKKYGFLIGGLLLGLSMGIYQAYLSVAMVLSVFAMLRVLHQCMPLKKTIKVMLRYLAMGLIGGIFYYGMLLLLLKVQQVTLSGYQGIGDENSTSIVALMSYIYKDFITYTLFGDVLMGLEVSVVLIALLIILGLGAFVILGIKYKWFQKLPTIIGDILLVFILPICFNSILMISPDVYYHSLMRYQWVLIPIGIIALIDYASEQIEQKKKQATLQWLSLGIGAVLVFQYLVVSHIAYFNLEKMYEKTYAYSLRLLDRMEETAGYYHGMEVAMIGVVGDHYLPSTNQTSDVTSGLLGVNGDYLFYQAENYQLFMEYYFGVSIVMVDIEEMPEIIQSTQYLELEPFPKENCMVVVDDVLYIKTEN